MRLECCHKNAPGYVHTHTMPEIEYHIPLFYKGDVRQTIVTTLDAKVNSPDGRRLTAVEQYNMFNGITYEDEEGVTRVLEMKIPNTTGNVNALRTAALDW